MVRFALILAGFVLANAVQAQSFDADVRTRNAISDIARAERGQAESMRSIERMQRERARLDRQDRQNAERDARSMRRFDR